MDVLDPKVDFVFKKIFGSEENKDVLLSFLNDTLKKTEQQPLTHIILVNPYLDTTMVKDKLSILDVRARTADGKQINLEIQLFNKYDIQKRTLFYWSKMYSGQLKEGQPYADLKKTITINILNFRVIPNDRYHSIFHLREDHTRHILTDDIEIHFLELPKLVSFYKSSDHLVRWLSFLKGVDKSKWEELSMDKPELKKAMAALEYLSQDEEARMLYEMRMKALMDERSALDKAEKLGAEKGKIEVIKNMLKFGVSVAILAEANDLTEEEVLKIKESMK
jgi:predicted transposase/invertase (TIGR01784 family)